MAVATAPAAAAEGATAHGDINYFMFLASVLSRRGRGGEQKELSGKLQVTLRQSSERIRGTHKSDFTAAKSEKFMEEGLYTQDMSADDTLP